MSEKKKVWEKMPKAELLKELGRYEKKIKDQGKQIAQMRAEAQEMRDGLSEISYLVDTIIDRVIDKYGSIGYGGEFVAIPTESPDHFGFRARTIKAGGLYIIARQPADKDKES